MRLISKHILLTIDVEDWFQVENFKAYIPFSSWPDRELRVEKNVHQLLNLFDEIEVKDQKTEGRNQRSEIRRQKQIEQKKYPQNHVNPVKKRKSKIKATFFVIGWIADRLPNLVREIQSRGHEVASHGYHHQRPDQLSAADLKMDLTDSRKRLEDLIGSTISGYRAPSFAINDDILKIIEDCGYCYDSSYNSFGLHGRYGRISLNGSAKLGIAHKLADNFFELPISNLRINGRFFPLGGGAYFRLIPLPMFRLGIKSILRKEGSYLFYLHPWEIDPEQPRVREASLQQKFRHYSKLSKTLARLKLLIKSFNNCAFTTCAEYLIARAKHQAS